MVEKKIISNPKIMILNLPDPPHQKVTRDYAGAYGVSVDKSLIHRKNSFKPLLNLFLPYSISVANESDINYVVIDAQAKRYNAKKTIQMVEEKNPDIIYTMLSLPSYKNDVEILKSINDKIIKVGCGEITKVFSEDLLKKNILNLVSQDVFPYVKSIKSLFNRVKNNQNMMYCDGYYYLKNGNMSGSKLLAEKDYVDYEMSIDELNLPDYEHTFIDGESILTIPLLGSRGCGASCMYCPYPKGFGNNLLYMDPNLVIKEIKKIIEKGANGILFRNQSFSTSRVWAEQVCRLIHENNLEIKWVSEARVDEVNKNMLEEMKSSGCKRLHYGVETGDYALINMAKPGVNLDIINKVFQITQGLDIWAQSHILLGLPGETLSTLKNTREFVHKLKPNSVSVNLATPYPGTPLFRYANENGLILTTDWSKYTSHDIIINPVNVNPESILETAKEIEKDQLKIHYDNIINKEKNYKFQHYLNYIIQNAVTEKKYHKKINRLTK